MNGINECYLFKSADEAGSYPGDIDKKKGP